MVGVHLLVFWLGVGIIGGISMEEEKVYSSYIVKISSQNSSLQLNNTLNKLKEKYHFTNYRKMENLDDNLYHFEAIAENDTTSTTTSRIKRELLLPENIQQEPDVMWIQEDIEIKRFKRYPIEHGDIDKKYKFNDPYYPNMWYIKNNNTALQIHMNISDVWELGITGKGVVVTILDDGIEHNHTDLANNYDAYASWDINSADPDPFPRYNLFNDNKHGTRCAGEVAAVANNNFCGIGVAYDAKIGGIRMLDGKVTDRVEAEALSLNPQHIDIYSSSWGPNDDGKSIEKPGFLADLAFQNGISKGRGGLGNIYIWASGNGGHHGDDCNCDGYTNSIYTLSVSSTTESGGIPWYSESCAVTIVSTPSSGSYGQQKIVTTDLHNSCTDKHTGTSASAPLLAGVIALAMEANRRLSWKDVQHMLVWSANPYPLLKNEGWRANAVGLKFHNKFGFGLVDAYNAVTMVRHPQWRSVGTISNTCESPMHTKVVDLLARERTTLHIQVSACSSSVNFLDYVQLEVVVEHEYRGHLSIELISPRGTISTLLSHRPEDISDEGFKNWKFNTVHMWGEPPDGDWTVVFIDRTLIKPKPNRINPSAPVGRVISSQLTFFGSLEESFYMSYHRQKVYYGNVGNVPIQRRQTTFNLNIKPPNTINKPRNRMDIYNMMVYPLEIKLLSSFPQHRTPYGTVSNGNSNNALLEVLLRYLEL